MDEDNTNSGTNNSDTENPATRLARHRAEANARIAQAAAESRARREAREARAIQPVLRTTNSQILPDNTEYEYPLVNNKSPQKPYSVQSGGRRKSRKSKSRKHKKSKHHRKSKSHKSRKH